MSQKLVLIVIVLSLCVGPAGGGAEWGQEPGGGRHEERIRTPDDGGVYISHLRSSVDPDSFGSLSVCSSQIRLLSLENSDLVYYKNKAVFYFYLNINIFSI